MAKATKREMAAFKKLEAKAARAMKKAGRRMNVKAKKRGPTKFQRFLLRDPAAAKAAMGW